MHHLSGQTAKQFLLLLILLGTLSRVYRIDNPLFDWHAYRQFDTAAIARNFYESGMNLLYPQVDWRGKSPGYVEVEFQLYTYPVAALYQLFGPQEWLGRAFNILIYVLSALLLFSFTRRLFDNGSALLAVFFYTAAPIAFFQSRAFQPDALLALGSLASIYYFWIWTEEGRKVCFLASVAGFAAAVLIKPPSLYLGAPLLYLAFRKYSWRLFIQPLLWLYASLVLVPAFLWFNHAYGLWETYGNTFGLLGRHSVVGFWPVNDPKWLLLAQKLAERLVLEIATPPGLILLILGCIVSYRKQSGVLWWWLSGFAVYVLLVPRGHFGHDHYQLPIVFVAATFMGHGAATLLARRRVARLGVAALLVLLLGFSSWQLREMMTVRPHFLNRIAFGQRMQEMTDSSELIVFVARMLREEPPESYRHRTAEGEYLYCDPIDFYLSHRKGWSLDEHQATPALIEVLRQRGARYVATYFPDIFERHPALRESLDTAYTAIDVTTHWAIYRLDPPSGPSASSQHPMKSAQAAARGSHGESVGQPHVRAHDLIPMTESPMTLRAPLWWIRGRPCN